MSSPPPPLPLGGAAASARTTTTTTTIVAYGALLSVASARLTFPDLANFRLVRVRDYRRCFAHPHAFLASRGLVVGVDDGRRPYRLASLSAEECHGASFVAAAFDVELDAAQWAAFVDREREYALVDVDVAEDPPVDGDASTSTTTTTTRGLMCARSSDVELDKKQHLLRGKKNRGGHDSHHGDASWGVWHWPASSGLLPADMYLRHCLLAVAKAGALAARSFEDDTLLADRRTTLRAYLAQPGVRDAVMRATPPADLARRFGG